MSASTIQVEKTGASASLTLVPYSVIGAGSGVEWEELEDGLVIRVPQARNAQKQDWSGIAAWTTIIGVQVFLNPSAKFIAFLAVMVLAVVAWRIYLTFFSPAARRNDLSAHEALNNEPIVLEVRSRQLFIYDPIAGRKPNAKEWCVDMKNVVDLCIGASLLPTRWGKRHLQFVLWDRTILKALEGHDAGELTQVVRLLQPRLQAAKAHPTASRPVLEPRFARRRIVFVDDAAGFLVRIPAPARRLQQPLMLLLLGWLVPVSAAAWMILQIAMSGPHSWILGYVATGIACIGFAALWGAIGGNIYLSMVRGEALGNEAMEPITLDVQGNVLCRHNPRSLRRNLKVAVDQILHVRAEPLRQRGSGLPMGRLVLELGDARRINLIRCHDLRELQELAPELEERLRTHRAKNVAG